VTALHGAGKPAPQNDEEDCAMGERFYDWLTRKYGWGEETFKELDEEFREVLVREYSSIVSSY